MKLLQSFQFCDRPSTSGNRVTSNATKQDRRTEIKTVARVALQSGDKEIMTRDLEMILTIADGTAQEKELGK